MTSIRCVVRSAALVCVLAEIPGIAGSQVAGLAGFRAIAPITFGRFELNTTGSADRIGSSVSPKTALSLETTLRVPVRSGGFWFGTAIEGSPEVDSLLVRPLARLGVWQRFQMVGVSVEAATHVARLPGHTTPMRIVPGQIANSPDTGQVVHDLQDTIPGQTTPGRDAMWSDVQGRLSWFRGRARFEAVVGARPGVGSFAPATWANVRGSYEITSRVALVAAGGSDPAHISLGIPASRFASVALRVLPGRASPGIVDAPPVASFSVHAAGVGSYRVTYLAPGAKSVELSGDFNGWKAITLAPNERGVWETTIPLPAGTYHVNVRVNGEQWLAPAGLPQAHDDFNGTVGIFVVP